MNSIHDIFQKFSRGEASLEESNTALKEAGSALYLDPNRNRITENELAVTTAGGTPEEAHGFGLLDVGIGSKVKVRVCNGRLEEAINEVLPDGSTSMTAYVLIGGKRYEVKGDRLTEISEHKPSRPSAKRIPKTPDMRRRTDLAGRVVTQHTLTGDFDIHYNDLGYAVKATRVK